MPLKAHAVLAAVSSGYPPPQGRFPRVTHPSATNPEGPVRLACVKHAASVRSEPGSNSQVDCPKPQRKTPAHTRTLRRGPRTYLKANTHTPQANSKAQEHASINPKPHHTQRSPKPPPTHPFLKHQQCQRATTEGAGYPADRSRFFDARAGDRSPPTHT